MKLRNKLLALSFSSTVVLTTVVAILSHSIPKFMPVFEELSNDLSDLPLSIRLILSTHKFWWVFPLATLSLGLNIFRNESFSMIYQSALIRVFLGGLVLAIILWFFTQESILAAMNIIDDRVNNL